MADQHHKPKKLRMPSLTQGLSARLLVLTISFVMIGEVLIYVPSVSRYRLTYLQGLSYFADAESEPMPRMRWSLRWSEVKRQLEDKVRELIR